MSHLGREVRLHRESAGLTIEALAADAEMGQGALWEIEYGRRRNPTVKTVCKLASALGVPPVELFRAAAKDWSNG